MDINHLLSDLAIVAGILLVAVLAVGPLWLAHDTQRGDSRDHASRRAHSSPLATD
ncbi:hypothetical protein [Ornithinimicrobium murale]|uniref:hypothetical protein n=1 Tax=Ornithinimicrobium murale TaxID=1050153 RepID=UPI0013B3B51F|nr:hypothetical protein [Ornithinimicrobium murale]